MRRVRRAFSPRWVLAAACILASACGEKPAPSPPAPTVIRLITGPAGGTLQVTGASLQREYNRMLTDARIEIVHSRGAVDNIVAIQSGEPISASRIPMSPTAPSPAGSNSALRLARSVPSLPKDGRKNSIGWQRSRSCSSRHSTSSSGHSRRFGASGICAEDASAWRLPRAAGRESRRDRS